MVIQQKALGGVLQSLVQQIGTQAIFFGAHIILARMLRPQDYGLIGLLGIFTSISNALMGGGLTKSLIRSNDLDEKDYSTVFYANLASSLVVYVMLFFAAGPIADFFGYPILRDIIRLYYVVLILRAFSKVQNTRLTKFMNFKLQMVSSLPTALISGAVGIWMAYNGFGVWSLVWMTLVEAGTWSILLWVRSKWVPSWSFDYSRLKKHMNFGFKVKLSEVINAVFNEAYNIYIAKIYSAAQLGFYTRALSLQRFPVTNISTAINKVTLPLFSIAQDDDIRLKSMYRRMMQQVLFWLVPVLLVAAIIAEPLFSFLLTDKWLPAVPYFQVLCIAGIFQPLNAYNLNILLVKGQSSLYLKVEIINKIFVSIGFVAAYYYGIMGIVWSQVASGVLSYVVNSSVSGRLINYPMKEQVANIFSILMIAFGLAVVAFGVLQLTLHLTNIMQILIVTGSSLVIYMGIAFLNKRSPLHELINQIRHRSLS